MKIKFITILSIIFFLTNITFAQSVGEYRVRKTETVTKRIEKQKKPKVERENNPERRGFYIMPEVGVGFGTRALEDVLNLQALLGYEFNNHFSLGFGTGINSHYLDHDSIESPTIGIPLYVNIHGNFSKHRTTAYYSLDLGVQIPIKKAMNDNLYYYDLRGIFISPEIGIRFNSCYLGINYTVARTHERSDPYMSDERYCFSHILSLKFGYKIPLNL